MVKRAWRTVCGKLIPGLTTAVGAVTLAATSVWALSALEGEPALFGLDAVLRVGLPSFWVGMILFPVNERALRGRLSFTLRAGLAALAAAAVHRLSLEGFLETWDAAPSGWHETLRVRLGGVLAVLAAPARLVPASLDDTFLLACAAISAAVAGAFLLQPMLLRAAREKRGRAAGAAELQGFEGAPVAARPVRS